MKSELHILQAIDSEGNSVYIDDVQNGKRCNCTCKECGGKLIARNKGKVRIHHFSHENGRDSIKCSQTALHLLAKEIISEIKRIPIIRNGEIIFAKVPFVDQEKNLGDIKPDLYAEYDGKPIAIEIFVTHKVDEVKLNKIKALRLSAVEINLSQFRHQMLDKETLIKELYNIRNINWLYDADNDFISEKKEIIQQFGLRLKKSHDNYLPCPMVVEQPDGTFRLVSYQFCKSCTYCCDDEHPRYIRCGYALPVPVSQEMSRKLSPAVIVNENKVMFASEFQKYRNHFLRCLPLYIRPCFRDPR